MSDQKPDTLSAQQLQVLQKQYQASLVELGKRMEIRDRALDQACRACAGINMDVVSVAKAMFEFLTADLAAAQVAPDRQTPAAPAR